MIYNNYMNMDFKDYIFLPCFKANLYNKITKDTNINDIFCTNGIYYTSDSNVRLLKYDNFVYEDNDISLLDGIYIKKKYFEDMGMNIINIDGYYFFPFFSFNEFDYGRMIPDIINIKDYCDTNEVAIGFNTEGEIKYNIPPFNKWNSYNSTPNSKICQGFYLKKYPDDKYYGKGIVICVSELKNHHKLAICLIKNLRYLNCNIPIEIFYSHGELSKNTIKSFHMEKNVKCIDISSIIPEFDFKGYQIKPYSILLSSFEDVILLDADSIVFQNLSKLFSDPNYIKYGNLFWLDQQNKKIHSFDTQNFILNNIDTQFNYLNYKEQCSSLVVINKKKKWFSLLGICGLNYNHKNTYKYLFGDKDTFWLGCKLFNQKYYIKNEVGLLTYPKELKDIRTNYCLKHGSQKITGEGDKVFLDNNNNILHLNQFKMDTYHNNIIHNSSWNFYLWDLFKIYVNCNLIKELSIHDTIFKIILNYHNMYLKYCNPNIISPQNIKRYASRDRVVLLNKLVYQENNQEFKNILSLNMGIEIDEINEIDTETIENNIIDTDIDLNTNTDRIDPEIQDNHLQENNLQEIKINNNDLSNNLFNILDNNTNIFKKSLMDIENNNKLLKKEKNNYKIKYESLLNQNENLLNKIKHLENEKLLLENDLDKVSYRDSLNKEQLKTNLENDSLSDSESDYDTDPEINEMVLLSNTDNNRISKSLKIFELTNVIKKDIETDLIDIVKFQKKLIHHLNSHDIHLDSEWNEIIRNLNILSNQSKNNSLPNNYKNTIKLLISLAKNYSE